MNKKKQRLASIWVAYTGSGLVTAGSSPGKKKRKADPPVVSYTRESITEANVYDRVEHS